MKPPPRTRGIRHRDPQPAATAPQQSQRPSGQWSQTERRKLLNGLRRTSRAAGTKGDMDYDRLRRYVPTRSVSEICTMVDSLKTKVVSWASLKVKTRKREEERVRKPIEDWMHMASSVAGGLEKTISTAFCQMLVVSSTEPCTLKNCDPPRVHRPPIENPPPGRTIIFRPMARVQVQDGVPGTVGLVRSDKTPASRKGRSRRLPAASKQNDMKQIQTCPPPQIPPPRPAATSNQQDPVPGPTTTSSAGPQTTSEQCPTTIMSTSPPSVASTSSSIHPTPPVSVSTAASHTKFGKTSKYCSTEKAQGVKYVVDFENIYRFLSDIQKPNKACCLTSMESAIMLDLLMSLPEELPLLDCNKLKKHLLQVYQGMSAPADSSRGREVLRGGVSADCRGHEAESQSEQSHTSSSQSEDGAASVECCPPLNPFMVPVQLLRRR